MSAALQFEEGRAHHQGSHHSIFRSDSRVNKIEERVTEVTEQGFSPPSPLCVLRFISLYLMLASVHYILFDSVVAPN